MGENGCETGCVIDVLFDTSGSKKPLILALSENPDQLRVGGAAHGLTDLGEKHHVARRLFAF
jgi:hypothetical protein